MICCLCGEPIRLGQFAVVVRAFVRLKEGLEQIVLEDGSSEKVAHYLCPANNGAPLELVGLGLPQS